MLSIFKKGTGRTEEDLAECFEAEGSLRIIYEGFLTKRGKVVKSWKRRFFALVMPGVLIYAEDDKNRAALEKLSVPKGTSDAEALKAAARQAIDEGKILGSIRIGEECEVAETSEMMDGHDFILQVTAEAPSKRTFYLSAPDEEQRTAWHEYISFLCNRRRRRTRASTAAVAAVGRRAQDKSGGS